MNWSLILKRNAAEFHDKECLVFGERRISWGELEKRVNALAQGLTDMGVRAGEVVAILLYNCPEYIELSFAVNQIGATWLPLNYRLAGPEFQFILNDSEAKVLVTEREFAPTIQKIRKQLSALKEIVYVGKDVPSGEMSYDELLERRSFPRLSMLSWIWKTCTGSYTLRVPPGTLRESCSLSAICIGRTWVI